MESTPKVRELSQPRIRDLEKEELLREPSESLDKLVALLALVQERSGGVTRKSRGSSQAPSLLQVVESRADSNSVQERSGGATRKSRRGANDLKKRDVIKVDTAMEFKIEDLTQFESSGPLRQSTLLDGIYTHVIARGIFEAGSSKNGATLERSMAKRFMDGMKAACKANFYDRFRYHLKTIVKREVDDNFSCSWENIESSIYQAIGQENRVKRLHGFNKIKASSFHSKPLEILIANIDEKINEVWGDSQIVYKNKNGKTISMFSFCLVYKYTLILGVVESLGSDFGQVKDVIEQEITSMMENPSTMLEIPDFQKKLVQDFTKRHVILTFRHKEV